MSTCDIIKEIRRQLGYLARNMDEAFDGALEAPQANAYASLVTVLGLLTTLEEQASSAPQVDAEREVA